MIRHLREDEKKNLHAIKSNTAQKVEGDPKVIHI